MRKEELKSRKDEDWKDFKDFRDEVNEMLMISKEDYQREFFNVTDSKLLWKRIEANSMTIDGEMESSTLVSKK